MSIDGGIFDGGQDFWIEIFFFGPELEKEGLMIDPGTEEDEIRVRYFNPFGQQLAGALNTVTKADMRKAGACGDRPAISIP